MNALSERALAHAHALRARSAVLPPEGPPREEILESWSRSQQAGLDFATSLKVEVVPLAELERRRERAAVVRRLAQAELETLSQQIAGSNFLLAFADPDGVVLDLFADHRFETTGSTRQILAGSVWTERACGTNGLGTALAAGRSVAVSGLEHYVLELGDISCTATPVRDAHGEVVGALDASSYFESRQRHTQTLVQMAAAQMENGLFAYQMRHEFMLAIHPRHEFLNTLNAGLLALGGDGRLRAVNSRGRQLLQGLHVTPGTAFDALFGEPFEEALVRMRRGGEVRLRDVMGSALAARCLGDGTGLFAQRFPGSATGEGAVRAAVAMPGNAADGANALAPASPAHADSIRLGAAAADVVVARARSRSQAKSESESESES
ncbi:MAG TPA: GAF domain-containing protein, partial [Burkholderiaceae bacterium]|nr:GAF domain-containing protein [Burkholderiaceae bacterium]